MTEITIDEYLNNRADYSKVEELKVIGKAPEKSQYLFANFKGKKVDLSELDTSNVTNMFCFFNGCPSLEEVNLKGLDTSKVTDMGCFFTHCPSLKEADLSSFDTSKVKNMIWFFKDCSSLEKIDLSSFNLENCEDEKFMFAGVDAEITTNDPFIIRAIKFEQYRKEDMEQDISLEDDLEDVDY